MLAANNRGSLQQLSTDDSFAHCIEDELGGVVQVQFLQNVSAMSLDGVGANVESCCYFFVRLPFGQELQDLSLAAGKQVIAIDRAFLLKNADVVFSQDAAHFRTKKRFVLRNRLDGTDQDRLQLSP